MEGIAPQSYLGLEEVDDNKASIPQWSHFPEEQKAPET